MANIVNISKQSALYPTANLWFLTSLKERLQQRGWKKDCNNQSGGSIIAALVTYDYPYSHDIIRLMERKFSDKSWTLKLLKYSAEDSYVDSKKKMYVYTWQMDRVK